jgi:amino acid adenylation domain-containing protein
MENTLEEKLPTKPVADKTPAFTEIDNKIMPDATTGNNQEQNRQALNKQELLLKILKAKTKKAKSSIENANRDQVLPLSWAQQQLWFISQLGEEASRAYHLPVIFRLKGDLDADALNNAFETLLARHEVLRTNIRTDKEGEPYQFIHPQSRCQIEPHPLPEKLNSTQKQSVYQSLIETIVSAPFDLATDNLIRAALIKHEERDHSLVLVLHHIVADAWSMGILTKELSSLYAAYCAGQKSPLGELTLQYADYALWQRNWLQGDVLDKETTYWREKLQGVSFLELPTDRPRPPIQSYRGARLALEIDPDLSQRLKALGQQHGCTLFMTLLAVFNVLLHRYTHQTDICVGTPIANRLQSDLEPLVGFFVNTLALRVVIDGQKSFEELLKQVKAVTLSAYEHQSMPFERVVNAVKPERSQAHSPLFQVMMVLNNVKGSSLDISSLAIEYEQVECSASQFDLTLALQERPDGCLSGGLEYASDLFDESTMARMGSHFIELVKVLSANPESVIGQVEFLTAQEKRQLLVEWNDTAAPYPKDKCIHELFEAQVAQNPDAVAVVFEDTQLTYGELNTKANQLAHYLVQERDVTPNTLVGICVERSLEMLIGILGILKAGGAYVPLDSDYPQPRLQYMLEDACLDIVITQSHLQEKTQISGSGAVYIDDADFQFELMEQSANNIAPSEIGLKPGDLAYVIYTSGSTGKPKGVMIEHGSQTNFLDSIQKIPSICKNDTLCAVTPISFDIHTLELFSPLATGATIALTAREVSTDPSELTKWVRSTNSTVLQATPSTYKMLVNYDWNPESGIRLFCGGESLPATLNDALASLVNVQLWNMYGPTETTVWSLIERRAYGHTYCSIGKPLQNTQVYILDIHGKYTPIGVSGELHIGGAGLARGYLNRPDLTAEKFIPNTFYDPFNPASSGRLYKTGDLCRYLPDGNIEFLGRIDHQVKIRGFRIELGEIECALMSHEHVKDTVVVAKESHKGDKQLVAYVVSGSEVKISVLKEHLSNQLPDYMVPSAFVFLNALPLTPNGKMDRKALESIALDFTASANYLAPRTKLEHQLAEIWSRVLCIDIGKIGIHDNFFELGGHSLLATRVVIQLRDQLKLDVALRSLFEQPTIVGLAQVLESASSGHQLPPIQVLKNRGLVATSFAQERLWFLDQFDGAGSSYLVPAVYSLSGLLDCDAMKRAFETLLLRHEILRTRIGVTSEGSPCQIIKEQSQSCLKFYSLINSIDTTGLEFIVDVDGLIKELTGRPFNLSNDDLIRVALIEFSATEHKLVVVMHHIITDGWSMGIFKHELSMLYAAYCQGVESPLSPLAIQYSDYSVWQREYLQGEELEKQSSYWKQQLQQVPLLELPADRPRPPVQSYKGGWLSLDIPLDLSSKLKDVGQSQGCTFFMSLLAVFNVLLHRYTRQNTLCIGTPIANRLQVEVEHLIGLFVNTLALRMDIDGTETFTALLHQTKETTLSAYEYQLIPFEKVVEVVQPERSQAYSPLFQSMLVLQNTERVDLELPSIDVKQEGLNWLTSKFDLTLALEEGVDGKLIGGFEYASDLFDESTIARMGAHFIELVKVLSTNPECAIGEVEFLTVKEKHQFLVEWNDTAAPYPKDKCIHELFEVQVEQNPDAVAVVFEDTQLTYGELNRRANQLAHYLVSERGVKPDTLVGICVERSLEMVIGILGILKAGAAYVPLDPDYPQARLQYMLEDAALSTIITQSHLKEKTKIGVARALYLDDAKIQQQIKNKPFTNLNPRELGLKSSQLAYVIYTSGSTGKPKGVMQHHKTIVNLVFHQIRSQGNKPLRTLQFASISFDVSIQEIASTLLTSGTLFILSSELKVNLVDLPRIIIKLSIQRLFIPPAVLKWLAEDLKENITFPCLREIFSAGDALAFDKSIQRLMQVNSQCCLRNDYGPTESHVVTRYEVEQINNDRVSIGRPIQNSQVYILDGLSHVVPVVVAGELHIGGEGLARGYLNRPELTAEKFIANPFYDPSNPVSSERLYKTGDLCRYLPDGNIEFLGRIDHQVKIRGFRIELGEIENALASYELVKDSVVLARENTAGEKQLVAYIVSDKAIQFADVKDHLVNQLPDYMIPSAFVTLDALPLTSNGKVDRKMLQTKDFTYVAVSDYVAPQHALERHLILVWSKVLGIESANIGVQHNFYDLGGTSLSIIRMIRDINIRITDKSKSLNIRDAFENRTIHSLAIALLQKGISKIEKSHINYLIVV